MPGNISPLIAGELARDSQAERSSFELASMKVLRTDR
jgi:hypothetical protein